MKRWLVGFALLLSCAAPARAHFVWIVPDAAKGTARAIFSDELAPDLNVPITKIAQTEFFTRTAGNTTRAVKATEGKGYYEIAVAKGDHLAGAVCRYGVVAKGKADPFLLVYHAWASLAAQETGPSRTPWERMKFQVVPRPKFNRAVVLWQGKPLAGAEVVIRQVGHDKDVEVKSDAEGEFAIPAAKGAGLTAVRAKHVEAKAGEFDGQKYKEIRHYTTAVFPAPAGPKGRAAAGDKAQADPAATKLLADARAARADWENFPGFSADLEVNVNGKAVRGKVEVATSGKVKVDLPDEAVGKWAHGQLASVVGHRMADGERETPCAFGDANEAHPLGRAIKVLNDELHSSYRIRGREIIEVNRVTKATRFTITVLENRWNTEKKYLPVSYVVNTWDRKSESLLSSSAFHHDWRRVGAFDLPVQLTVVTASGAAAGEAGSSAKAGLTARTLTLTNHKLSK